MFIKVRNHLAPKFTTEDFRIQVTSPLANHVYGCHVTLVTHGALECVSFQKGMIQGHIVQRYAPRKAKVLCSRIVFWAVLSLDVSTQIVFLYQMSVKYTLKRYYNVFGVHVTHWLLCQTDEISTIFNPSLIIYMGTQVDSSAIANIYWVIKTLKYQSFGLYVYFKSILVHDLKTKSGFDQNVHIT